MSFDIRTVVRKCLLPLAIVFALSGFNTYAAGSACTDDRRFAAEVQGFVQNYNNLTALEAGGAASDQLITAASSRVFANSSKIYNCVGKSLRQNPGLYREQMAVVRENYLNRQPRDEKAYQALEAHLFRPWADHYVHSLSHFNSNNDSNARYLIMGLGGGIIGGALALPKMRLKAIRHFYRLGAHPRTPAIILGHGVGSKEGAASKFFEAPPSPYEIIHNKDLSKDVMDAKLPEEHQEIENLNKELGKFLGSVVVGVTTAYATTEIAEKKLKDLKRGQGPTQLRDLFARSEKAQKVMRGVDKSQRFKRKAIDKAFGHQKVARLKDIIKGSRVAKKIALNMLKLTRISGLTGIAVGLGVERGVGYGLNQAENYYITEAMYRDIEENMKKLIESELSPYEKYSQVQMEILAFRNYLALKQISLHQDLIDAIAKYDKDLVGPRICYAFDQKRNAWARPEKQKNKAKRIQDQFEKAVAKNWQKNRNKRRKLERKTADMITMSKLVLKGNPGLAESVDRLGEMERVLRSQLHPGFVVPAVQHQLRLHSKEVITRFQNNQLSDQEVVTLANEYDCRIDHVYHERVDTHDEMTVSP